MTCATPDPSISNPGQPSGVLLTAQKIQQRLRCKEPAARCVTLKVRHFYLALLLRLPSCPPEDGRGVRRSFLSLPHPEQVLQPRANSLFQRPWLQIVSWGHVSDYMPLSMLSYQTSPTE